MDDGWETYQKGTRHAAPAASITAQGQVLLNAAAWAALGQPARVAFRFRRTPPGLGIYAAGPDARYTVKASAAGSRTAGRVVSARSVLQVLGYDWSTTRRFRPRIESGMLIIDLEGTDDNLAYTHHCTS